MSHGSSNMHFLWYVNKVGAIYIWTYVYVIMGIYANKNVKDSTSIQSSGETSETFSETCTEVLLPSENGSTSEESANQDGLPSTIFGVLLCQ